MRAQPNFHGQKAKQILDTTAIKGGQIVHVGCGDGVLTTALPASDSYLVQGLDRNADNVEQARKYIKQLNLHGPVSIDRYDGKRLPYIDNLVNLVVAEDLGSVPIVEALRVLAPGGKLYTKQNDRWRKIVKPRPANIDEWTHYFHDTGNGPAARYENQGSLLMVVSASDETELAQYQLDSSPVFDGMAAAYGQLYTSMEDGSLLFLTEE